MSRRNCTPANVKAITSTQGWISNYAPPLLAQLTSHSMFFLWIRSKPRIEIGYLVSLGQVFEEIFLGKMLSVFLNKLLHNTILL